MRFDVEKLKQKARPMTDNERREINERDANRDWLALSARFALSVREILRNEHITQTELASRMGVSCSQVTKILSGKENLSLQTIAKIEKALAQKTIFFCSDIDMPIISSLIPYETETPDVSYQYACESKSAYLPLSTADNNDGKPE